MITYIGVKGDIDTRGIYGFETNPHEIMPMGKLSALAGYTYMVLSKDKKYLYATGKDENGKDLLCGYAVLGTGVLRKVGQTILQTANDVCHLDVSNNGKLVVVTDFVDGAVHFHPVEDGMPKELLARVPFIGSSIGPRQEQSHPHSAYFTPDDKYCLAVDLGANAVFSIAWDQDANTFMQVQKWEASPAAGPRHLAFHPNQKYVYVLHEITADISVLTYNPDNGELMQVDKINALPPMMKGYQVNIAMDIGDGTYLAAADITVSKDGKKLYASTRGCRDIASFAIAENGHLKLLGHAPSKGYTRSIHLSEDDAYLIGIGEKLWGLDGMLEVFAIDAEGKAINKSVDAVVPGAFNGTVS